MRNKLELKVIVSIFSLLVVGVCIAFALTTRMVEDEVYEISRIRMEDTTKAVKKAIENSMIEADAEFTRNLVNDLKQVGGYELNVFNHEGREAFNKKAMPVDDPELAAALEKGEDSITLDDKYLHAHLILRNLKSCQACHGSKQAIIGAVEMSISIENELASVRRFTIIMALLSFIGLVIVGTLFWIRIRREIIQPVQSLESAAVKMSEGDLSFETNISSMDEIGRLDRAVKDSLNSISRILERIKDVSKRVAAATEMVEHESDRVLDSTIVESEAVAEISTSVEELNVAIAGISDNTENLTKAMQSSAVSVEEMTTAISSVKEITAEVSEGIDTTTSSIHQFSASIKEVVENATELSKVSDETLSAVEEITTTVKEVEGSAKESARMSQKVMDDSSNLGIVSIRKTMDGMEKIRASVSRTSESIDRLGGRSEEIGHILNVIDDITDQTTLLSLNAAILAAQAGEHGKGFSVVANEIKDLAVRTALSTKEIDSLITTVRQEVIEAADSMREGIEAVDNGMKLARDTSQALNMILDSARKSAEMSASIERTTTEQANTAKYVTDAIERVRYMVEHIVKATTEQSRGVGQIMSAAEKMKEAAMRADRATEQQAVGSKQILNSVDDISEMTLQMSSALKEQKVGSQQIWMSISKMKDIPESNRKMALKINKTLRELGRDVELINLEMERFSLYSEKSGNVINLSVIPFEPPAVLYRKFAPFANYLSGKLGKRVNLRVENDFESVVKSVVSGETSLSFLNPTAYVDVSGMAKVQPLKKTITGGKATMKAAIITREHSNINALTELKGRVFAFTNKMSSTGYLVPRAMLADAGIKLEDLSSHAFLGYYQDVANSVLSGESDAGAVMEVKAKEYSGKGIKVVALSDDIPGFVLCVSPSLDPVLVDAIGKALSELSSDSMEAGKILKEMGLDVSGFVDASDSDFEPMRKILHRLEGR